MVADHQGGQHQAGVTPGLGPHSITFVLRMRPDDRWWVIHVIPAIPACPVRPKSGHSANARVYEYTP